MLEPYSVEIEIFGLPSLPNVLNGKHWRVRHKHTNFWKAKVFTAFFNKQKPEAPLKCANLILTRLSARAPDHDNLAASWKPVIDGLRYAGIIFNDDPETIGAPKFVHEKARQKEGRIRIRVEEILREE